MSTVPQFVAKDASRTIFKLLGLAAQEGPPILEKLVELCFFRGNPQGRTVKKWLELREDAA